MDVQVDRASDFTSFSTYFQSYQDDKRMKMKRCVQWKSVNDFNILPPPAGIKPGAVRSAGQRSFKHSALLSEQMGWMNDM